jgi:hypothetical protein
MERRDKLILLLLLAGGGYATYRNWDVINTTLGLDDIAPGRVKAIDLAKRDTTFHRGRPNSVVVQELARGGEIELAPDAWQAQRQDGDVFRVTCTFRQRGESRCYEFEVDVSTGRVTFLESESTQPPR